MTPSSSRQGSLWTKASIWYLARMNSDLVGLMVGLGGTAGCGVSGEGSARPAQTPPSPRYGGGALTALCPGGSPSGARSALGPDPAASAPRWSWPRCSPRCEPSAEERQSPVGAGGGGPCGVHVSPRHVPGGSAPTWSRVAGQGLWRRCLTMEMWRPRLRCTLQHSSQMSTPRLMEAQPGSVGCHGGVTGCPHHSGPLLPIPPRCFQGGDTRVATAIVSLVTARGSAHHQGKPTGFP